MKLKFVMNTHKIIIISFIFIFLISCINNGFRNHNDISDNFQNKNSDSIKPIITAEYNDFIDPLIFEAAFYNGTKVNQGNLFFEFNIVDIGKIKIETGKIIACDVINKHKDVAFAQKFPVGEFAVQLSIANIKNDKRVAFSRIIFSDKPVVKWEVALEPGQAPIGLRDSTIYCYGVDSGLGIFMDEILNDTSDFNEGIEDLLIPNTKQNGEIKTEQNLYEGFITQVGDHNYATFSTGFGDGCYATYIGFDKNGSVCRLLTDFGLVAWWTLDEL